MKSGKNSLCWRSWVTIHRRLELPCWPSSEQGLAAVIHSPEPVGNAAYAMLDLQRGSSDYSLWPGISPKQVLMILPMPDVELMNALPSYHGLAKSSMALTKDGWKLPQSDADVFCLWNPKAYFPKLTSKQVADRLLVTIEPLGGAVYSSNTIAHMMHAERHAG